LQESEARLIQSNKAEHVLDERRLYRALRHHRLCRRHQLASCYDNVRVPGQSRAAPFVAINYNAHSFLFVLYFQHAAPVSLALFNITIACRVLFHLRLSHLHKRRLPAKVSFQFRFPIFNILLFCCAISLSRLCS
jgi:hypothetical protein